MPLADVVVQIQGDSIGLGQGATREDATPDDILRRELQRRWPSGVRVVQGSHAGSTTQDRIDGTGGVPRHPDGVVGQVYIVNYGVNDVRQDIPVDTYKANLERIASVPGTIIQTPTPVATNDVSDYAQAARDVAAERDIPLADANAFVSRLPRWQSLLVDGIHPSDELYRRFVSEAVAPVVMEQVAKLRCE